LLSKLGLLFVAACIVAAFEWQVTVVHWVASRGRASQHDIDSETSKL